MSDPLNTSGPAIFVNMTAFKLELDVGTAINVATSAAIRFKKPLGSTGNFTATIDDPTGGIISHTFTATGEINEEGNWTFWSSVVFPTGTLTGRRKLLRVFAAGED